jgi:biotin transporter BioY
MHVPHSIRLTIQLIIDQHCRQRPRLQIFLLPQVATDKTPVMNWLAIICAAVVYWILGWLWYSVLFGKIWVAGLEQHGVKLEKGGMAPKMIGTFIANLVAAVIMMRLIARTGIVDLAHGLKLGAGVGAGFSATAITIQYLWESKPFKVWLIDASYHFFGCILLGAILSAWH